MSLTKPAGCALQVLGLALLCGGCLMVSSALHPGSDSSSIPGFIVLLVGAAMMASGGMRARQKPPA
jgi:drug/metabolite transporter (DMT)-like permease